MIIGSGPIVIGQACEFDYSGTQACKALRGEGYEVVLINSNPATIMTDPDMADKTYVEPINPEFCQKIIERELPDALLPTLGGQTALNTAVSLGDSGVLERYGVELIGASLETIKKAENRNLFRQAMEEAKLPLPPSRYVSSLDDGERAALEIGFPVIVRPSFTLGGEGAGSAYDLDGFRSVALRGLARSPIGEILIEKYLVGWKEFELELMRDSKDNVVVVCSIENVDPMGVHTGDSITVAPAQTLTDREYQLMRNAGVEIMRKIGVDTGGSNIQFAVDPETTQMVIIEMNPRVSRSSALASKATGFPIAKIAAKLAVGYSLDEIQNDITEKTPASFEPAIDYCCVKIPKWNFSKFPGVEDRLGMEMKSIGEVMALGRTFKEALKKALFSLEEESLVLSPLEERFLKEPNGNRIHYIEKAVEQGWPVDKIYSFTKIDRWFLHQILELCQMKGALTDGDVDRDRLLKIKKAGFSDSEIAQSIGIGKLELRKRRESLGIVPTMKKVDTCAAEFEAYTPYFYSTYEVEDEAESSSAEKIVILGAGPNRIGQGIEFDYICCQGVSALRDLGYEAIMVNSNPETVSTDYDTSDRLYFEPVTLEHVLNVIDKENPRGVILQFGGQTPLKLANGLHSAGVRVLGTSPDSIDRAEDREKFISLLQTLGIERPASDVATSVQEAVGVAKSIGYPVLVRPSYVLGGRAMGVVYDEEHLLRTLRGAFEVSHERPILVDRFLEDAIEIDVDAVSDGEEVFIGAIMEHIEEAGIHSGDSACVIPPFSLGEAIMEEIATQTRRIAEDLEVVGLINLQFAIKDDVSYCLEVNPRASRTVPFVSKARGISLTKIATRAVVGQKLRDMEIPREFAEDLICVKIPVFPFGRFLGASIVLGPEMKSTGEVMGISDSFGKAFGKALTASGLNIPLRGKVFISVKDRDKRAIAFIAKRLRDLGFKILATKGTARTLRMNGVRVEEVLKFSEGSPNIVDEIRGGTIDLIINTPHGRVSSQDGKAIRANAVMSDIPCITTVSGAQAVVNAIESMRNERLEVRPLQELGERV